MSAVVLVCAIVFATRPDYRGQKPLPKLNAAVSIQSDRFAIPTIKAETRLDAFYALGYNPAHDRLFQLELYRRATPGRLAEIFGPDHQLQLLPE